MNKVLGLDLGTNSIGWALINTDTNQLESCGTRIFPNKSVRQQKKDKSEKRKNVFAVLKCLHFISFATLTLTLLDKANWQFWLNLSLTTLVATLTILHQNKK